MTKPKLISNIDDFNNIVTNSNKYYLIQITSSEDNDDCIRMNNQLHSDLSWIQDFNGSVIWCEIYSNDLLSDNNLELFHIFSNIKKFPTFFLLQGPAIIEYFSGGFKEELLHFIKKNISN